MKMFQITLALCTVLALQALAAPVTETPATTEQPDSTFHAATPLPIEDTPASNKTVSLAKIAEEVKLNALNTGNAAYLIYDYLFANLLNKEVPPPAGPCFLQERDGDEFDGQTHSDIDYMQKILEDRESLRGYYDYLLRVEREYNATLVKIPVCGFCVRFHDIITSTKKLMTSLDQLILIADPSLATEEPPTISVEDRCYGLCFEQQARTYLRYQGLTYVYIVNDLKGLLQQDTDKQTN